MARCRTIHAIATPAAQPRESFFFLLPCSHRLSSAGGDDISGGGHDGDGEGEEQRALRGVGRNGDDCGVWYGVNDATMASDDAVGDGEGSEDGDNGGGSGVSATYTSDASVPMAQEMM